MKEMIQDATESAVAGRTRVYMDPLAARAFRGMHQMMSLRAELYELFEIAKGQNKYARVNCESQGPDDGDFRQFWDAAVESFAQMIQDFEQAAQDAAGPADEPAVPAASQSQLIAPCRQMPREDPSSTRNAPSASACLR